MSQSRSLLRAARLSSTGAALLFASSLALGQGPSTPTCDPAMVVYVPAKGEHGLLLFEDLWPSKGDVDFNDASLAYNYAIEINGAGQVSAIHATFNLLSAGATIPNEVKLRIPGVAAGAAVSIVRTSQDGTVTPLTALATESDLVVPVFPNDTLGLFGDVLVNTLASKSTVAAKAYNLTIQFAAPVTLDASTAPFDVYLERTGDPGHQIHRPEYGGTANMNVGLFGTADDGTSATRHFVDTDGLPFALNIPQVVDYPKETIAIDQVYPDIIAFARSGGADHADWYLTNEVKEKAFTGGANGSGVPTPDFIGPASPCAGATCVSLSGAVGLWDGDDVQGSTARDRTSYGDDAAITGAVPIVPGLVGNAFQFGGADQAVEIPDSTLLELPTSLTLEAWVKPSVQSPTWWRLIGKQTDDQVIGSSYILGLSPQGTIYFALFAGGAQTYVTGDTVVQPGKWSHIAATWDGSTMTAYLNGVAQSHTASFTGPPAVTNQPVRIGKGNSTNYIFNGLVDEATIFNRALSDAEVMGIVSAGAAGKCKGGALRLASCAAIHGAQPALPDGVYNVTQSGTTFRAYCDMTRDGGGWTRVVNIKGNSIFHADQPAAVGDVSDAAQPAKLSDALISQMTTLYWRFECGASYSGFLRNTCAGSSNQWTSMKNNSCDWSTDQSRGGTFSCAANRAGYVFSDWDQGGPCTPGHTDYAAAGGAAEGLGCFDEKDLWNQDGSLWVK